MAASDSTPAASRLGPARWVAGAGAAATLALVFAESPVALAVVLMDGAVAAAVVALAALPGLAILRRLVGTARRGDVVYGVGLGVGLLSLLMLALGLWGELSRAAVLTALGVVVAAGTVALLPAAVRWWLSEDATEPRGLKWWNWAALAMVPFAALTLIVATAPPGTLWGEEANGYDVLEYHLAAPKAYYDAGRIHFLPQNTYANFPQNAEMLYLLAMVIRGGPVEGVMLAQMFNAALALLTVAAAWAAARPCGARAAALSAILAGTCGWLVYLSGVAYVENAMLLFTTLALGAAMRATRRRNNEATRGEAIAVPSPPGASSSVSDPSSSAAWLLLCGLFAGLACGCKYTAIPLVALPLALVLVLPFASSSLRRSAAARPVAIPSGTAWGAIGVFALGVTITFGPWLAKNVAFCGNPVFPLATKTLGWRAGTWSAESADRWENGHRPPAHARSIGGRLRATWGGVIAHPRTGPALWLLAAAAIVLAPRTAWLPAAVLLLQMVGWASLTHLVDRMAVPVLPTLFLLAAIVAEHRRRAVRTAAFAAALLGAAIDLYRVAGLYYDHARLTDGGVAAKLGLHGQTAWFVEGQWPGTAHLGFINGELPPDAKLLMVGDARPFYVQRRADACVVFNPNPLADAARRAPGDAAGVLAWLRREGYTHVYVDRMEMRRLRSTYGFWPEIDEGLFERLERAGLRRVRDFGFGPDGPVYGTIYEVGS